MSTEQKDKIIAMCFIAIIVIFSIQLLDLYRLEKKQTATTAQINTLASLVYGTTTVNFIQLLDETAKQIKVK
jgi:uncharacterized membrane protein YwzB